MMTQAQFNGNTGPFLQMLNPCAAGENLFISPSHRGGEALKLLMVENECRDVKQRPYQSVSETPLWPSLKAVRAAMGKGFFWKQELEKALNYRSLFISAAMLTMLALGVMAI